MSAPSQIAHLSAHDASFRQRLAAAPDDAIRHAGLTLTDGETRALHATHALLARTPHDLMTLSVDGPDWQGIEGSLPAALTASPGVEVWIDAVERQAIMALRRATPATHLRCDLEWLWQATTAPRAAARPFLLLFYFACEAAGGDGQHTTGAAAAWSLLHLAARLQDDLADNHESAVVNHLGTARTATLATSLIFAATSALSQATNGEAVPAARRLALHTAFAGAGMTLCEAQYEEASDRAAPLDGSKGAVALGLACWAGGLLAGAPAATCEALREFGTSLGLLMQLSDDLQDFFRPDDNDLRAGRASLVLQLTTQLPPTPLRARLTTLFDGRALSEAQAEEVRRLVVAMGGLHHWLLVSAQVRDAALSVLGDLRLCGAAQPAIAALAALLDLFTPWAAPRVAAPTGQ